MQKRKVRNAWLFISSLLIGLFSFPFAFAKSVEKRATQLKNTVSNLHVSDLIPTIPSPVSVYDSLRLNIAGLNRAAFELAQKGFEKLREQGVILNDSIISIIDFSLPSTDKRLYVVDLKNYQVLYSTYVAHGKNSGKEMANSFSNSPSSNKSSLGFYKTLDTYNGKHATHLNWKVLKKASMITHTKEPLYFMVQNMWIPIIFQGLDILDEARVARLFHQKKQLR